MKPKVISQCIYMWLTLINFYFSIEKSYIQKELYSPLVFFSSMKRLERCFIILLKTKESPWASKLPLHNSLLLSQKNKKGPGLEPVL
jgi:hypothetical protein